MTHFLDTLPLDFSRDETNDLRDFLANTFYRETQTIQIVQQVGMQPASLNLGQSATNLWWQILVQARDQDKIKPLLATAGEAGGAAVATRLDEFLDAQPAIAADHAQTAEPDWKGFDDPAELERLIVEERSSLLDVAFLRRGSAIAPSICRLSVRFGSQTALGTGCRIGPDLLLTNHHVLFDWANGDATPDAVTAWFGYEREFGGAQLQHEVFAGDAGSIVGDKTHDWAAVRMTDPIPDKYAPLTPSAGTPVAPDDRVYIIQHPDGGPKQIGMHHNLVRHVDDNVIQYWTDTKGGSSGSPVFNSQWELVGLHHRYVEIKNGTSEFRNQGRRIERVIEGLEANGLP